MKHFPGFIVFIGLLGCSGGRNDAELQAQIRALNLERGDITLCSSNDDPFGKVAFSMGCSESVRPEFNIAAALLHSFEYTEAEKMFARVLEADPQCVMAYWGAAMSMFHPLWEPPTKKDLAKGATVIALGRTVAGDTQSRERDYLEAIATIFDGWENAPYPARLAKFENATKALYEKYPDDPEAAVFYALALRAVSDPADKTYVKQRQAGQILEALQKQDPNHPGVVHYIIHVYDYPELADQGLEAARSYASIAAASAHAQHMPSHIFTRLGLWDEAAKSNINSISAAQCYAQSTGIKGHWDEELHGMDYLIYAYLQKGDDDRAKQQLDSLNKIEEVHPETSKVAYSVAAMPARYAVERKDWKAAAALELTLLNVPWERCIWEKANNTFARALGAAHLRQLDQAAAELAILGETQRKLQEAGDTYRANLLRIQVQAADAWLQLAKGNRQDAIRLMTEAADLEDRTEKHSVTPGEIVPARELLGDMYAELGMHQQALDAYKSDLVRHPNRFNGVSGAARAAERLGLAEEALAYYQQLVALTDGVESSRADLVRAKKLLADNSL